MTWTQRLVGLVFLTGLIALGAAIFTLVRQAEGVPPMPIYAGLMGAVALILLAGGCMALISIAISARRGAEALRQMATRTAAPTPRGVVSGAADAGQVFSASSLGQTRKPAAEPVAVPARPARPAGRSIVAER